ncbi:hypothetical protein LTR48_007800, partial [Friedmanniomyces endolithicus]
RLAECHRRRRRRSSHAKSGWLLREASAWSGTETKGKGCIGVVQLEIHDREECISHA